MAVAQGYGKIVISGSVFAYDVGDTRNSYIGEPAVNLVPNADTMANWGSYSAGNDGTFITEFGTTGYRVRNKNTWNGIARGITLPTPGTYTISAWFRIWGKSSGNNGINVYTSGGGISDTAQGGDDTRIGEWQRISMTRTYTTTSFTFYIISWGGTSGVDWSSWDVTKPQVELKSHVTPFIAGTRSATQGLLDLTGNNTIDLSNVSFDSNAQMTFDGTDDNIYPNIIINGTGLTSITAEFLVKSNGNNKNIIKSNSNGIILHYGGAGFYLNSTDSTTSGYLGWNGKLTGGSGVHEHLVATWDGTTMKLYVNGEPTGTTLAYSGGSTGILKDLTNVVIGSSFNSSQPWFNGTVPVTKIYNRALTAAEVNQNYRHYKTRFNLS